MKRMDKNNVSIVKCDSYDENEVNNAVKYAIEKDGCFPDVRGKSVLIKPNLLYPVPPEKAVTTHPAVIDALIKIVKDNGAASIAVGDSPGVASMDNAGRKSGVYDVVKKYGAEWINFDNPTLVEYPEGKVQKQFYLAEIVCKSDIIISVPKLKTHEMMYFTGAMKNLFGTVPGLNKSRFHFNFPDKDDFASMIVDLNGALKADYALMDAVIAMEGPGPGSGYPKKLGFIAASSNVLALDFSAARIIGYDPLSIPVLKDAMERKIWLTSPREINYSCEHPDDVRPVHFKRVKVLKDTGFIKNILPAKVYGIIKNLYVPRPFFSRMKCIGCGKCAEICPPDAIFMERNRKKQTATVDYNKCIRCYCCHEVCPADAIRISRF